MSAIVKLGPSNRIVLPAEVRRAAGLAPRQKLKVSARPGRIVLERIPETTGKVVKRAGLKVWTGAVPSTPLAKAVEAARHYER
ncbi:MAG: AbrB/MazE/SpoVT family DNA-binding domain-containing protein [Verrucomicrobiales bacterium]|nr:AbrB/MazE/SpoVT family DNA-binding domain-containing protein [Verrucomicrobiales bacterium]